MPNNNSNVFTLKIISVLIFILFVKVIFFLFYSRSVDIPFLSLICIFHENELTVVENKENRKHTRIEEGLEIQTT